MRIIEVEPDAALNKKVRHFNRKLLNWLRALTQLLFTKKIKALLNSMEFLSYIKDAYLW